MAALELLWFKAAENSRPQVGHVMWIDKLADGVIRVVTPIGPRYIQLSLAQRAYFLWMFRHFDVLPQQVLSPRQQRVVDRLCIEKRFVGLPSTIDETPIIGTLERIPLKALSEDPVAHGKEATTVNSLVADLRQRP